MSKMDEQVEGEFAVVMLKDLQLIRKFYSRVALTKDEHEKLKRISPKILDHEMKRLHDNEQRLIEQQAKNLSRGGKKKNRKPSIYMERLKLFLSEHNKSKHSFTHYVDWHRRTFANDEKYYKHESNFSEAKKKIG